MLRLAFALSLLFLNLFACEGGYDSCKLKITHSNAIKNSTLNISVPNSKRLIYSNHQPNAKVLKHDIFLNLYLIKSKDNFKHPFTINNHLALGVASVDAKSAIEGKILKRQSGLNNFARFSEKTKTPALLLNSCCNLEGIVTDRGIIEKVYLERFLSSSSSDYGDVGIRVDDTNKKVTIQRVDPFYKNNPFKVGDIVVSLDGKKVYNSATLMRQILFSKISTFKSIKIKRGTKYYTFKVRVNKRYGGGYLSDTFLEQKGIYFSPNLCITQIRDDFDGYGLKVGDRLIQVNGKKVSTTTDIATHLNDFNYAASLLFLRDGFEFFVNIKGEIEKKSIWEVVNCNAN
ncbi:hypothetical protein M947_07165 [Sulfurimonas hongkongensis]|uniref:Uncharacterized protein n=1 Tax=Sulfurimonas hongkongensis TaxID=1172190 RepID=T0L0E7_9BACT|nr:PDZ domain-containing protein [Sulfurimonas hongkongensis]EQB39243.1 hypothetical protein M947_07165 [Sulfurimonas hongkongensis]